MRVTTYAEAFDMINVRLTDKVKVFLNGLEKEGYSEKSICYTIAKSEAKIMQFRGDSRFLTVIANEVRKNVWTRNDPRWKEYNERKAKLK